MPLSVTVRSCEAASPVGSVTVDSVFGGMVTMTLRFECVLAQEQRSGPTTVSKDASTLVRLPNICGAIENRGAAIVWAILEGELLDLEAWGCDCV